MHSPRYYDASTRQEVNCLTLDIQSLILAAAASGLLIANVYHNSICACEYLLARILQFPVVLVTGATGYIATHIIKVLQEVGGYRIRATARSVENNQRLEALKSALKKYGDLPEFVAADLLKPETWEK